MLPSAFLRAGLTKVGALSSTAFEAGGLLVNAESAARLIL
jgi:hypothetical protein